MSRKALRAFFAAQIEAAKKDGILFSLHVKTTMMKISDPILFGHCVSVFFADVFEKHGATLTQLGVDPDNGVGDMLTRIETLPEAEKGRDQGRYPGRATRSGPASPWSIPTRASPICTCRAT